MSSDSRSDAYSEEAWIELVRKMVDGNEFSVPRAGDGIANAYMPWTRWQEIDHFIRQVCRQLKASRETQCKDIIGCGQGQPCLRAAPPTTKPSSEPVAWTTQLALDCQRKIGSLAFEVSGQNLWGEKGVALYASPQPSSERAVALGPSGEKTAIDEAAWELLRLRVADHVNRCLEIAVAAVTAYNESKRRQTQEFVRNDTGVWPKNDLRRAFVEGMKWWQYTANGATAFPAEVDQAEAEAQRRYVVSEKPASATAKVPEVTDAWAERFCEAVNWHPDGTENKIVEGEWHSVTFRELAKGYIRAMLAAAPTGNNNRDGGARG